jgi:putative transposase
MTAHLRRHGHRVAACTVDRLMRDEGMSGVIRGRKHRTTIPGGKDSRRAPDLLDRDSSAAAPNLKWVTDFTYCRTWSGFVYVAFVVDCFSRAIVGWHAATSKDTAMVTTALKMALWRRDHADRRVDAGLIHHSEPVRNIPRLRSRKRLCWRRLQHLSVVSVTPTTMPWLRPRSGCSRPKP